MEKGLFLLNDWMKKVRDLSDYTEKMRNFAKNEIALLDASIDLNENKEKDLTNRIFTNIKWPYAPKNAFFEPIVANASYNEYYQKLRINNVFLGIDFRSNNIRGFERVEKGLIIKSQNTSHKQGEIYLLNHITLFLKNNEFEIIKKEHEVRVKFKGTKKMKDLITGEIKDVNISFSFFSKKVDDKLIPRDEYKSVQQYGADKGLGKRYQKPIDTEEFVVTVPNIRPHPFLLDNYSELGFSSRADFVQKTYSSLLFL